MTEGAITFSTRAMERNLIACALNDAEKLELLDLEVPAFEGDELRTVYSMIVDLKGTGHQTITIDTLRMFFDSRQDFYATVKEHGGYAFLESLNAKPDHANFHLHLETLRQRYDIRVAKAKAATALKELVSGEFSSRDEVYGLLDNIVFNTGCVNPESDMFNGIDMEWLEEQSQRFVRGEFRVPGIPIKNTAMRDAFGPYWYCGGLTGWCAETNVGKSQAVGMLTRQMNEDNIPVLVLDNEMEAVDFRNRIIASSTGIPLVELVTGNAFNPKSEFYRDLKKHIAETGERQKLIEWRKVLDMTYERVEPIIRRFLRKYHEYPYKCVIVDGIKMTNESDSLFAVGYLVQKLKALSGRFATEGIHIHFTAQLQRPPRATIRDRTANPPDHNAIGLSKLIADNATTIAIMTKEPLADFTGYDPTKRRIFVSKHRFHNTLEVNSYLSCEFDGKCAFLNPLMTILPKDEDGSHAPEGTPGVRVQKKNAQDDDF
jgi:replicative DNA helicase